MRLAGSMLSFMLAASAAGAGCCGTACAGGSSCGMEGASGLEDAGVTDGACGASAVAMVSCASVLGADACAAACKLNSWHSGPNL